MRDMYVRFDEAKNIVGMYAKYDTLKDKYYSAGLMAQVILRTVNVQETKDGIQETIVEVNKWVNALNRYYDWEPTRETRNRYKMFFPGNGFVEKDIEWNDFRVSVQRGKGIVCNYVLRPGGRRITINDFNEIKTGMETMTHW